MEEWNREREGDERSGKGEGGGRLLMTDRWGLVALGKDCYLPLDKTLTPNGGRP